MILCVLGVNHKTAPLNIREKFNIPSEKIPSLLSSLKDSKISSSAVILSTCNRSEIYCELNAEIHCLISWFSKCLGVSVSDFQDYSYQHFDLDAVKHLMEVASGLDSMIIGENQILGQVKKAFSISKSHKLIQSKLGKLFQKTFQVTKEIKNSTEISNNSISVAYAACALARQIFSSLIETNILLIGAGETIELCSKHIMSHGCNQLYFANRTLDNAHNLANEYDGKALKLNQIDDVLNDIDIIISSTGSSEFIIYQKQIEKILLDRNRPLFIVDLAVPRDVEPTIDELENVFLYNIDDMNFIVDSNLNKRKSAVDTVKYIIENEALQFMSWVNSLESVESIKAYRTKVDSIKDELLIKSIKLLKDGEDPEKVMLELSNKLVNKLIHQPTRAMNNAAYNGDFQKLSLMRDILGLNQNK